MHRTYKARPDITDWYLGGCDMHMSPSPQLGRVTTYSPNTGDGYTPDATHTWIAIDPVAFAEPGGFALLGAWVSGVGGSKQMRIGLTSATTLQRRLPPGNYTVRVDIKALTGDSSRFRLNFRQSAGTTLYQDYETGITTWVTLEVTPTMDPASTYCYLELYMSGATAGDACLWRNLRIIPQSKLLLAKLHTDGVLGVR